MDKRDDSYTNVLLEDMRSQMQVMLEITIDTRKIVSNLPTREEFNELKDDVHTIKHAVAETNKELKLLDRRVTRLEEKIA